MLIFSILDVDSLSIFGIIFNFKDNYSYSFVPFFKLANSLTIAIFKITSAVLN